MGLIRWLLRVALSFFRRRDSYALIPPDRLDWNAHIVPKTVEVDGARIFYIAEGDGDPIILIHGYGAGIWVWEKQIDFFRNLYRVHALDLIGHGFSDRPRIDYTPEAYIDFFIRFMDAVGLKRATLIGNSMGGGLAWVVAGLYPARVDRLVLVDSIPPDVLDHVENESFRVLAFLKKVPFLAYPIFASRDRSTIRSVLRETIYEKEKVTEEVIGRQYAISAIEGSTWSLYSTYSNARGLVRFRNLLSQIRQPTLIIWGERDRIFSPSVGRMLQCSIQGARLEVIPGCGHIPMWERPDIVNGLIHDFLEREGSH